MKKEIDIEILNTVIEKQNVNFLKFIPFRRNNGVIEKLVSFDVDLSYGKAKVNRNKSLNFATESKLSQGEWYKIGVTEKAIYK